MTAHPTCAILHIFLLFLQQILVFPAPENGIEKFYTPLLAGVSWYFCFYSRKLALNLLFNLTSKHKFLIF
jgi:hypothetical protein